MRAWSMIAALLLCVQQAGAADLLDIYRRAASNEPKLAASRAGLDAASFQRVQSRAPMLPQIALLAGTSWDAGRAHPENVGTDHHNAGYALVLTQSLWSRAHALDYQRGQLGEAAAHIAYAKIHQDLMLKVARAYFDVLLAQDTVRSSGVGVAAASMQHDTAARLLREGSNTRLDMQEAEARRDLAQARQVLAENAVQSRREALRRLLGEMVPALAPLRPDVAVQLPQPADIERWAEVAQSANLDVLAAQIAVDLATKAADKAQVGYRPALDLIVASGQFSQNGGLYFGVPVAADRARQTSVGLRLTVPIYSGGAVAGRIGETAALLEKSRQDLLDAQRNAAMQARQAYLDIASARAQIAALQIASRSGLASVDANRLAYAAGTRVSGDVLGAEQQAAGTMLQLAQARYDLLVGQLNLKAATGALGVADLEALNAYLVSGAIVD